ncbi:MAG: nitrous oxide reductase family maturation protein NosD [Candidatus Hodarchaeota archaeon]
MSNQDSENFQIKVLYLFNSSDQHYDYDNYANLFSDNETITLTGIEVTEFSQNPSVAADYQVIIVGYSAFHWRYQNPSRANAIVNTNCPVLALGRAGNTFFRSLGYGGGMSFGCAGLNVTENHEIFSQTFTFPIPGVINLNGTGHNTVTGTHFSGGAEGRNFLVIDSDRPDYALLVEYTAFPQKMLYLAFWYAPSIQSSLYMLIHNCIEWLAFSDSIIIEGNLDFRAQATMEGWSGNGTVVNPYIIEGVRITHPSDSILIRNTDRCFLIRNCLLVECTYGITFENVTNGSALNNILDNTGIGIHLRDSRGNTLANNTISTQVFPGIHDIPLHGITLDNSWNNSLVGNSLSLGDILVSNSASTILIENSVIHAGDGISIDNSENCTLTGNIIAFNEQDGIDVLWSNNCLLTNNRVINNSFHGFNIVGSINCTLSNNTAVMNGRPGISLSAGTNNNTILFNNFYANNAFFEGQQATDDGTGNFFMFNYWTDYLSEDLNDDGFGDSPYLIDGSAHNSDQFPSLHPTFSPVLPHALYSTFISPTGGEILTGTVDIYWAAYDTHNHVITNSIFYSGNNGATWSLLIAELTHFFYFWDTTTVPNGAQYLLQVNIKCEEGTQHLITTQTFTISNFGSTLVSDYTSFLPSTAPSTPSRPASPQFDFSNLVQLLGGSSILFFLVTLIVIIRRLQREK